MINKRSMAVVSGAAIAALVCFAATLPRWREAPNAPDTSDTQASTPARPPAGAASAVAVVPALAAKLAVPGIRTSKNWAALSPEQRTALEPFASDWNGFSDRRKRQWLTIAARYQKLSPDGQKRLHAQMMQWLILTPEQRRQARENYQISKSVPLQAREDAWKAYQNLPDEQKNKLAASERKSRRPLVVSAPPTGKTEVKDLNRTIHAKDRRAAASGVAGTAVGMPGAHAASGALPASAAATARSASAAHRLVAPAEPGVPASAPAAPKPAPSP